MQEQVQNQSQQLAVLPPAERAVIALDSATTEKQLRELAAYSAGIVAVTDKDSRTEAHNVGMRLKNARVAIEKAGKAAREDAQAFSKAVIAEEKRLVTITQGEEDRVFSLRDGYDAKVAAEKAEAERRERERVAAIRAKIDTIKGLAAASFRDTSEQIAATLADLESLEMTEADYAKFAGEAAEAKAQALAGLRDLFDKASAAEAEAARVAAERAELERLRAEAAERERLATEQRAAEDARLAAEREAIEADRRALAAHQAELLAQQAAAAPATRQQLDAARDVAPEDRPHIVTYDPNVTTTFVGVDLSADNDEARTIVICDGEVQSELAIVERQTPSEEDESNFRAAVRALLATHTVEQARIVFDEELQRAIHGGVAA